MWQKLLKYNVNGKFVQVVKSMYHNIQSVNPQDQNDPNSSHFSEYFTSNIGVRQGENLSPILFSLFLNDLEEYLINKNNNGIHLSEHTHDTDLLPLLRILVVLYADDTVLIANDHLSLQKSLNDFMEFVHNGNWKKKQKLLNSEQEIPMVITSS